MLNAPAKQVIGDNGFGRGIELVGNKDVIGVIIILIPLAKNNYKLDGNITIFQFCLKRVRFMRNFRAIRGLIFDGFGFVPIMFFDSEDCFYHREIHQREDTVRYQWENVLSLKRRRHRLPHYRLLLF